MSLAEGVSARVVMKPYATGVITANTQPVSTVDPAVTGGQTLRRVSSSLKLAKDTYQSNEVRSDRQIVDFRHGVKRVTGGIAGEFSPATYWDLLEASLRGTDAAPLAASNTEFTSAAADNATSKFTFAGGDPVTVGYRVGDIVRFTNLTDPDNNGKNFLVTGFSAASNRDMAVYPAPDTMGADTTFNITTVGRRLFMPSSSFVSRKFAFEHYFADIDISELFTECRMGGFNIALPATGLATCNFDVMGRDMEVYTGGAAPFFTAPAAELTTGIFAAVNGLLQAAGTTVGVVTGLNLQATLSPSSDPVVGQNFVPEIFLGRLNITGQLTAMLQDATFVNYFKNETEVSVLAYLTTTTDVNSPAASIYLPRIKFGDADIPLQGEGGQIINMPFQALKYVGAGAGIEQTTIRFADTEAT